jgi:hypothetical protein
MEQSAANRFPFEIRHIDFGEAPITNDFSWRLPAVGIMDPVGVEKFHIEAKLRFEICLAPE